MTRYIVGPPPHARSVARALTVSERPVLAKVCLELGGKNPLVVCDDADLTLAAEHAGFEEKEKIKATLDEIGVEYDDLGTNSAESVDYPDYAARVAEKVSQGRSDAGILACGTGIGMSIVANKFKDVRAAVVSDEYAAKMAKEHNNANILCLGGRIRNPEEAKRLVSVWLETQYAGGRHDRRLEKIREIEKKNLK